MISVHLPLPFFCADCLPMSIKTARNPNPARNLNPLPGLSAVNAAKAEGQDGDCD
jgi:hypothetical protein